MPIVDVERVAQALNLDARRVQQLVKLGMPKEGRGQYDAVKCLLWYIRYLQAALEKKRTPDHDVLLLVAWEHRQIAPIVRALLAAHGADAEMVKKVKDWEGKDFDSMYIVTISQLGETTKATFDHKHEGLDGQPNACPH